MVFASFLGKRGARREGVYSPLLVVTEALRHMLRDSTPKLARIALHPRVRAERGQQRLQSGGRRRHSGAVLLERCALFFFAAKKYKRKLIRFVYDVFGVFLVFRRGRARFIWFLRAQIRAAAMVKPDSVASI